MSGPVPGTPTPWFSVPYGDGDNLVICSDQQGEWRICFMATPGSSSAAWQDIQANAAAIVHRMNNWDAEQAKIAALVEALGETHDWIKAWSPRFTDDEEWPDTESKIESALALAKGEEQ